MQNGSASAAPIYPVILSGGSGTRLWPMSRAAYPKQLLPLISERSLLQESVLRVGRSDLFEPPTLIANDEHRFIIAEQLRLIGAVPRAIVLEPVARNTAPAAAIAALHIGAEQPGALMLVMPSDHRVENVAAFHDAVAAAASAAAQGLLVTFGITADRPETGYGYIKQGTPLGGVESCFHVDRFVEKPDRATAEQYLSGGGYSWNSGIFLFPVDLYLAELERLQPQTVAACRAAVAQASLDLDFLRLDSTAFSAAAKDSIDYAVLEHTEKAAVIPVSMGWSDVGAWDALWDIGDKTGTNVLVGDVIAEDTTGSYLRSEDKLLAAIGVEDMIVVATSDAVLVVPRSRAQDVKRIVERLQREERPELTFLPTVHRPWGTYRSIHNGERVQVKHIMVKPGEKLSLQKHHHRSEHWIVVSGTAIVTRNEEEILLSENQSTYIPLGAVHRLENPGKIPLHLIEVQSGSYFGEDDIVRFHDTYGRVTPASV